jgi:hypothetical protein
VRRAEWHSFVNKVVNNVVRQREIRHDSPDGLMA